MKNLFDSSTVTEIKTRLSSVRSDSQRQWGTMTPAQAIAHCTMGLQTAVGDMTPPRLMIGHLIGWIIRPMALGDEQPFRRNSPTAKQLIVNDWRDLEAERARLLSMIDRFEAGGPTACTKHPHAFFGSLTPDEWAVLMYKHLDHHLRQFGA